MYKIKDLKNSKDYNIIGTDKCEKKLFSLVLGAKKSENSEFLLLSPLPGDSLKNLILERDFKYFIVNDFGTLEYFKEKNIILGRIITSQITRNYKNMTYFFEKFLSYNIKGIFIDYDDFFNISMDLLEYLNKKEIKLGIFIKENVIAYSPRCHYMANKKEKGDFYNNECELYCEEIDKEKSFILGVNKEAVYDYKSLIIKNNDFSRIKEDRVKFSYIDYLIY